MPGTAGTALRDAAAVRRRPRAGRIRIAEAGLPYFGRRVSSRRSTTPRFPQRRERRPGGEVLNVHPVRRACVSTVARKRGILPSSSTTTCRGAGQEHSRALKSRDRLAERMTRTQIGERNIAPGGGSPTTSVERSCPRPRRSLPPEKGQKQAGTRKRRNHRPAATKPTTTQVAKRASPTSSSSTTRLEWSTLPVLPIAALLFATSFCR